jgi:hypothetical protein
MYVLNFFISCRQNCFVKVVAGLTCQRRHVFRDLRFYVCTFKGCPKSKYLFSSRYEWFDHETEFHRREWYCSACNEAIGTRQVFQDHLLERHSGSFLEHQIQTVIDSSERPTVAEQLCPLCGEKQSSQHLRHHLRGHMQQIALFVLP